MHLFLYNTLCLNSIIYKSCLVCLTNKTFSCSQDPKIRNLVLIGSQGSLEEKTVTVCYGADFVNVTFINFCCTRKEIAQVSRKLLYRTHTHIYKYARRGVLITLQLVNWMEAHTFLYLSTVVNYGLPFNSIEIERQH